MMRKIKLTENQRLNFTIQFDIHIVKGNCYRCESFMFKAAAVVPRIL